MPLGPIPFRVRIGVTGHRTIQDPGSISRRIREILHERAWEFFEPLPARKALGTRLAFTLLSSLAEGADRLAAAEILKIADSELEAVLPMAKDKYLLDFATAGSRTEFHDLLHRASRTIVLREVAPDNALDEVRNKAYEAAGRHVVDHCNLLIAVWDGKPARGRGGTAEIVAYAREKGRPLIVVSTLDPYDLRLEKNSGLDGQAFIRLGGFNSFAIAANSQDAYVDNMHRDLFGNTEGDRLDGAVKERIRSGLLPWYVRASLIAKRSQKNYLRAGLLVYSLSPLAVAAVALAIFMPQLASPAFVVEFILLGIILLVIVTSDRHRTHQNWIEARFLAERIRSAVFLTACGVQVSSLVHIRALRPQLESGEWALRAFDEIMRRVGQVDPCDQAGCDRGIAYVRRHWLQDQIQFHVSKAKRSQKAGQRLEKAGWFIFVAAIIAAGWHLVDLFLGHPEIFACLGKPLVFLAVVLPALGAAIGGIRGHREYSRLAKRSQYMQAALQELDSRFAAANGPNEMQALLDETEQLLLQEAQEWLVLMKFARVEAI
jgi:hypothetical protein